MLPRHSKSSWRSRADMCVRLSREWCVWHAASISDPQQWTPSFRSASWREPRGTLRTTWSCTANDRSSPNLPRWTMTLGTVCPANDFNGFHTHTISPALTRTAHNNITLDAIAHARLSRCATRCDYRSTTSTSGKMKRDDTSRARSCPLEHWRAAPNSTSDCGQHRSEDFGGSAR